MTLKLPHIIYREYLTRKFLLLSLLHSDVIAKRYTTVKIYIFTKTKLPISYMLAVYYSQLVSLQLSKTSLRFRLFYAQKGKIKFKL